MAFTDFLANRLQDDQGNTYLKQNREIQQVHEAHPDLPIFCIGGIKKENLPEVTAAGAKRAVIVSGILQAPDIAAYVREAKSLL